MTSRVVRIAGVDINAGIVVENDTVTRAAPALTYMIGWTAQMVRVDCQKKSRTASVIAVQWTPELDLGKLAGMQPAVGAG